MSSNRKGKSAERQLAKIFSTRFNQPFSRVVGSGNRPSQVPLTEEAKKVLTSDITTPNFFKFSIESKCGYNVNLFKVFDDGNKVLDSFLRQAQGDAKDVKKSPMLCWKKDHQPWLVFIKKKDMPVKDFAYLLFYRDWCALSLAELLKETDDFFYINHGKI